MIDELGPGPHNPMYGMFGGEIVLEGSGGPCILGLTKEQIERNRQLHEDDQKMDAVQSCWDMIQSVEGQLLTTLRRGKLNPNMLNEIQAKLDWISERLKANVS